MHIIYTTFGSKEEALGISRALVDEDLIACANVAGGMTSVFKWEGEVKEEGEIAAIFKTSDDAVGKVNQRIKQLHSYDCPCVIAIKIEKGNEDFIKWVENSIKLPY